MYVEKGLHLKISQHFHREICIFFRVIIPTWFHIRFDSLDWCSCTTDLYVTIYKWVLLEALVDASTCLEPAQFVKQNIYLHISLEYVLLNSISSLRKSSNHHAIIIQSKPTNHQILESTKNGLKPKSSSKPIQNHQYIFEPETATKPISRSVNYQPTREIF